MLNVQGVLETSVYVDDMDRAHEFYGRTIGLERIFAGDVLNAYDAGRMSVLLVFQRDERAGDMVTPGGVIPGHNSTGPAHFAFRIGSDDYEGWKAHLTGRDVAIISEVTWPAGGKSLYFRDPDGNVLEMATPGTWTNNPL